jgi:hypothetical protein
MDKDNLDGQTPEEVESDVEKRLNEALADAQQGEETLEVKPQIVYGISLFWLSNGKPHVVVTGDPAPSLLELQMLLAPALANIEGDITAAKVVKGMAIEAHKRQEQMMQQMMRRKLEGK